MDCATVRQIISSLLGTGERVEIESFHVRRYPSDADDIAFVLCALNGEATYWMTCDGGFAEVVRDCPFTICEPLAFLHELRCTAGRMCDFSRRLPLLIRVAVFDRWCRIQDRGAAAELMEVLQQGRVSPTQAEATLGTL